MMWELKQRYNGYRVEQYNVIIDVQGGYSKQLLGEVNEKVIRSESTERTWADSEVGHLNHFEHCQNI